MTMAIFIATPNLADFLENGQQSMLGGCRRYAQGFGKCGSRTASTTKSSSEEPSAGEASTFKPFVDIVETETNFVLAVELAGVSKEDIEISRNDQIVSISGHRQSSLEIHPAKPAIEHDADFEEVHADGLNTDEQNTATIKGKESSEATSIKIADAAVPLQQQKHLINERSSGHFKRSFRFDKKADLDQTSATFNNGLLYITIAKKAQVVQTIEIA